MEGILGQIREGALPEHAQKAVIQGIMPLEPEELLEAIFLIGRQNEAMRDDAKETFEGLPEGVKKSYFEDRDRTGDILGFFLRHFSLSHAVLTVVLLNANTPAESIRDIAATLPDTALDIAVNNQVKILEEPDIIGALRENPALSINQKQKLDDYERLLLKPVVSEAEELETKDLKDVEAEAIAEAKEFVQVFGKERDKKPATSTPAAPAAEKSAPSVDEGLENRGKAKEKVSVLEQITNMSVPQKVQAAIKGDREVRGILVRDSNKLVCSAVIKSPRVTDAEIEFYSNLRNIQTDVLRLIAMNREWMKNYKIVHNLVKNPRTPLAFSMKLLPRLNKKDVRNLMRDRGVPEALRTMARRQNRV